MRMRRDNRGFSLVEPLMIVIIFSLFGFMAFSLIQAGDKAYGRITDHFNSQSGARIAMGYIHNRLCQNDRENAVSIAPNPLEPEGNALRIEGSGTVQGYSIWIFWSDGMLLEFYGTGSAVPVREYCFEIIALGGFDVGISEDGQTVRVAVPYAHSGGDRAMVRAFPLKTGQSGGAGR